MMPLYPRDEWQRVDLPQIHDIYPTISFDVSEEFAWGSRDTVYDIEVTRLALEGEDTCGVRILKEGILPISPKSPTWWRIFHSYLQWKTDQEYEDETD